MIGRDYAYRKVRERVLAGAQWCALCGGALDWSAAPRTRWSPSVDHVLPISRTRHLDAVTRRRMALEPENLRAVHYGCNSARGNRRNKPKHISRDW